MNKALELLSIAIGLSFVVASPIVRAESIRISGAATAVDGDTLRIGGERIRLLGGDAPEARQSCSNGARATWRCGAKATAHLRNLIDGRTVNCAAETRDAYHRPVAICYADGRDINDMLVRGGYAVATPEYSTRYVEAEREARREKRGIWGGHFQMPADFRRHHR